MVNFFFFLWEDLLFIQIVIDPFIVTFEIGKKKSLIFLNIYKESKFLCESSKIVISFVNEQKYLQVKKNIKVFRVFIFFFSNEKIRIDLL